MPRKIIEKFDVEYLQILNESGSCDANLCPKFNQKQLKGIYEYMVLSRVFDEKALKLQRQGRIGTYASIKGQEAQIGPAIAVNDEDLIFPAFRENGVFLVRGMPPELIYQYWAGDERGMCIPDNVNMFPVSITVGGHMIHAVGAAMAFKYKKEKRVAVTYFGDGATSEGDFHEAMNFAGALNLPVVFICQNNQWAISLPFSEQTASKTIAQKAIAYGFKGIRVDGNDVFGMYVAAKEALKHARAGKGPILIEALTYRLNDHTTSDDAKKYRKESLVKPWAEKDPILRLEKYLKKQGVMNDVYKKQVLKHCENIIDKAVDKFEKIQPQKPEDIFNFIYSKLTPELKEQQQEIIKEWKNLEETKKKKLESKGQTLESEQKGEGE